MFASLHKPHKNQSSNPASGGLGCFRDGFEWFRVGFGLTSVGFGRFRDDFEWFQVGFGWVEVGSGCILG